MWANGLVSYERGLQLCYLPFPTRTLGHSACTQSRCLHFTQALDWVSHMAQKQSRAELCNLGKSLDCSVPVFPRWKVRFRAVWMPSGELSSLKELISIDDKQ